MISLVPWTFDEAGGKWEARLDRRSFAIAWDQTEATLYLSVVVDPPANVQGSQQTFSAPIPLLAAMLILPASEHELLAERVQLAQIETRDMGVLGRVHDILVLTMEGWPKTASATEKMALANEEMPKLERLSLDLAAARAWM